ncbi:PLDc N-terminal domain-containing protein [Pedobacter frigoris]
MIYGLVQVLKNKSLTLMSKIVWIFIVVFLPVLGTAGYLRTTFKERHGRW